MVRLKDHQLAEALQAAEEDSFSGSLCGKFMPVPSIRKRLRLDQDRSRSDVGQKSKLCQWKCTPLLVQDHGLPRGWGPPHLHKQSQAMCGPLSARFLCISRTCSSDHVIEAQLDAHCEISTL